MTKKFVSVLIDSGFNKALDYAIPPALEGKILPGMRLRVPLRTQLRKATVISLKEKSDYPTCLPIEEILSEEGCIPDFLFPLGKWISQYYCCSLRQALRSLLPSALRCSTKARREVYILPNKEKAILEKAWQDRFSLFPGQAAILKELIDHYPHPLLLKDVLKKMRSRSPLQTLIKKSLLKLVDKEPSLLEGAQYFISPPKQLNSEQASVVEALHKDLRTGDFCVHLLHGITGSGKTEVYFAAMDEVLSMGKNVIILIPEIALASQLYDRLKLRFKEKIATYHHRLSKGQLHDNWQEIYGGKLRIVIGARSAVFAPLPNLGLIIVDEEHENAYKQSEEAPCYCARDVAIIRARQASAQVILGSATPSMESYYNAQEGKYKLHTLKRRIGSSSLPRSQIIDMRIEYKKNKGFTCFSSALLKAIEKRYTKGEQSLLLLNRRGYHSVQVCSLCGFAQHCKDCDCSMTYHKGRNILSCHLCGTQKPPLYSCPACGERDGLTFKGMGTELIEKKLLSIFKDIRVLRLDADTTRKKGSHESILQNFRAGKGDVLLGTQMIAKGLDFSQLTLVGILQADRSLHIPDFRSAEKTFQLITQVSGRAGRASLPGEVIIQTSLPQHACLQLAAKQDFLAFYEKELAERKSFFFPPFSRMSKLLFVGKGEAETLRAAENCRHSLSRLFPPSVDIHPVIPSGHSRVKGQYRYHFFLRYPKDFPSSQRLKKIAASFSSKKVRLIINVDPLSTFF